jgi:hypothetical protein
MNDTSHEYYTLNHENATYTFMGLSSTEFKYEFINFINIIGQTMHSSTAVFATSDDFLFILSLFDHASNFTSLIHYYYMNSSENEFKTMHKKIRETSPLELNVDLYPLKSDQMIEYFEFMYEADELDVIFINNNDISSMETLIPILWTRLKSHGYLIIRDINPNSTNIMHIFNYFNTLKYDFKLPIQLIQDIKPLFILKKPSC